MAIFLRSPSIASRVFGLDRPGQVVRAVPRMKFMYFVEFTLSTGGAAMTNNADLNTDLGNRGISFKVRQVDKPKINLNTVELNQYNKKKLAYTKTEYQDVSMKIYDTVDDSVLAMWVDYFTYYFGDSRIKRNNVSYKQSPINPTFVDDSGWGFRPLIDDVQFFDKITVYAFYANTYTAFSYMNPRIVSIDWQQKEYSGNDPEEISVNFKYESIKYEEFGQPYDFRRFGWLPKDAFPESPLSTGTIPNVPSAPKPRIFAPQNLPQVDLDITAPLTPADSMGILRLEEDRSTTAPAIAPGAAVPQVVQQSTALFNGAIPAFSASVTDSVSGAVRSGFNSLFG